MTIEEARQELDKFCDKHWCKGSDCPLAYAGHKCGNGFTFMTKPGEDGYMTDDEIVAAYETAFRGSAESISEAPMSKEQILMEIKKAHATIHEMEDRLKNLERYKEYEDMANEIKAVHTAFMNSGFSNEQAYDLLKTTIAAAMPSVMKGLI